MNAPAAQLADAYRLLPLNELHESPLNHRRRFNDAALQELADNIARVGVLTPLLVRPNAAGYEIAAGHRRFRAAQKAGIAAVPCMVRAMNDNDFLEVMTIENLQREDIHPLDEALGYQTLLDNNHLEVAALAAKVGKSESYIYQRLKLTDLAKPAQKAFLDDKITAGHAILIARLQPKDQAEAIKECTSRHQPLSVRGLQQWIDDEIHLDLAGAPFDTSNSALLPKAGDCIGCPKRTGTQPALFPDIGKKDTCTDPACFKAKIDAGLAAKKQELKELGLPVVAISENWYSDDKANLNTQQYTRAGNKACQDTKTGLVVEGSGRGQSFKVCTNKQCRVHHPAAPRQKPDAGELARRRAHETNRLVAERLHAEAFVALRKQARFDAGDVKFIARQLLDNAIHGDEAKPLCDHHGIKVAGKQWGAHTDALAKTIEDEKNISKLQAWLLEIALLIASERDVEAFARRRGIDPRQIRRAVATEIKAKAKTAGLQTSAKPSPKKTKGKKP